MSSAPLANVVIVSPSGASITRAFPVRSRLGNTPLLSSGATTTINVVAGPSVVSTAMPAMWHLGTAPVN